LLPLRPSVSTRFQSLFHSPRRGSFHRSLTVLVRYRSSSVFSLGGWTPQFPTALACAVVLRLLPTGLSLRLRDSHPLWSRFPPRSTSTWTGLWEAYNPGSTCPPVWAAPRSLATTSGILSVPPGTEMFQFPGCPSPEGDDGLATAGFPHSEIAGSSRLHTADRRLSQCTTSFLGTGRLGIPRVPSTVLSWFDGEADVLYWCPRASPDADAARPSACLLFAVVRLLSCGLTRCVRIALASQRCWCYRGRRSPGGCSAPSC